MNYLEIAQKTWELCKLSGGGPGGVTGQQGMTLSIINWVQEAYREVQEMQPRWNFMEKSVTATISQTRDEYVQGDFGITEFAELMSAHIVNPGMEEDTPLKIYTFEDAERFQKQADSQVPSEILVTSTETFKFNTLPDVGLNLRFKWHRTPHELVNSNDLPIIPARFHMLIAYIAMEHYAFYDEDQILMEKAARKIQPLQQQLISACAPKLKFGANPFLV